MSPIDCDMHDTGGLARSDPDRQSHGPLPDFQRLVAGTSRITESPFRDCGLPFPRRHRKDKPLALKGWRYLAKISHRRHLRSHE